MNKISFLYYQSKKIELKERNLIITGKNGSGKTRFLRQLEDNLINNRYSEYQDLERENLLKDIKYGIDNFPKSLDLKNNEIKISMNMNFEKIYLDFTRFFYKKLRYSERMLRVI